MITYLDKLRLLGSVYSVVPKFPAAQFKFSLLNPVDCVRYTEFSRLLKFLNGENLNGLQVLDVSSPFVLSFLLARGNHVIKTDIDPGEGKNISPSSQLMFKCEDATKLSFADNSFDLTCSVSVIEHIYCGYLQAVQEMIRVTKPGGHIYLTFPVSAVHKEEWYEHPEYMFQRQESGRYFFQYRFDEHDVMAMVGKFIQTEVLELVVHWERRDGCYDRAMSMLKKELRPSQVNILKNALINLYNGFYLLNADGDSFSQAKSFGNAILLLRKT